MAHLPFREVVLMGLDFFTPLSVLKFDITQQGLFGASSKLLLCFPTRALQYMCKEEIIWHFWTLLLVAPVLLCDESVWEEGDGCVIQALQKHRSLFNILVSNSQSSIRTDLNSLCNQLDFFCNSYSASQIISHNEDLSRCLSPQSHLPLIKMSSQPA